MDLCRAPFLLCAKEDLLMVFWLTILEILKLGLLLDVPIYLLLAGLLPATDGFYFSKWVGRGPKLLLWGTLLHVLCTWGGTAALRRNIPVAPYLAYLPYLLLSLFCLALGLSLLRFRSRWLGCFCLLHGASSLAVLLFRCLKMAGLFYTGW